MKRYCLFIFLFVGLALMFVISTNSAEANSVGATSPAGCTWSSNGDMVNCTNVATRQSYTCATGGRPVLFSDGWGFEGCGAFSDYGSSQVQCEVHGSILLSDCGEILCGNGRYDDGGAVILPPEITDCSCSQTHTGTQSCFWWETVDWGICDLTAEGVQEAIQEMRTDSCEWTCSCNYNGTTRKRDVNCRDTDDDGIEDTCDEEEYCDCGGNSCSCIGSCDPGCPPNDEPTTRPCGTCGDNNVALSVKPSSVRDDPEAILCPGITPAWPADADPQSLRSEETWLDEREDGGGQTVLEYTYDPFNPDPNGDMLPDPSEFLVCNPLEATYIDLTCEECDDGFCGSDECYGPVHGAEYACRFRPSNCGDGVVQRMGGAPGGEFCDDPGGTCKSDCSGPSYCGDGELNQPLNGGDEEEECDHGLGKDNTVGTDDCSADCKLNNEGYIEEVLPD